MIKVNTIHHSIEELMDIFDVDIYTGKFYWTKYLANERYIGQEAGAYNQYGYCQITVEYKVYLRHRLMYYMYHGKQPPLVDHINGVPGDDRIENLQELTCQQNIWKQKLSTRNKHGYPGIAKIYNKYAAYICVDNKNIYLGLFNNAEAAGSAYLKAKRTYHKVG